MSDRPIPHVVVEPQAYLRQCHRLGLDEATRYAIVDRVAADPTAGTSLGAGLYKIRVGIDGRGRRGGLRTIYLYWSEEHPVYLLAVYDKTDKVDLTPNELEALRALARRIQEVDTG